MDHRLIKGPDRKTLQKEALDTLLQNSGLTEYDTGKWCQSGAQAGWSPDLDVPDCAAVVVYAGMVTINNDIYSERVKSIEVGAVSLGYSTHVKNTYDGTKKE